MNLSIFLKSLEWEVIFVLDKFLILGRKCAISSCPLLNFQWIERKNIDVLKLTQGYGYIIQVLVCLVQQLHLIVRKARIERNESMIRPAISQAVRGTDSSQLWTARDQVVKTTHPATSDQCPGVAWPLQEGARLRGAGRAKRSEEATETKLRDHFPEQVSQTCFSPFLSKFKQTLFWNIFKA